MKELLASRVARAIVRDYIERGQTKSDEALPRMQQLAEEYGVSIATVAHALGQMQALGWLRKGPGRRAYVVNRAEANGSAGGSIGLAIPEAGRAQLLLRIYEGVQRACRLYGRHLIMTSSNSIYCEQERDAVVRLREAGCQAIVLAAGIRTEEELAHDYLNTDLQDIPIVLVDMALPKQKRSQVVFDNFSSGLAMTRLLLSRGHRRISFMTVFGSPTKLMWRSNTDRHQGYLAALRCAGVPESASLQWDFNPQSDQLEQCSGYLQNWRRLPKRERPTALMALDDGWAEVLVEEAMEMGLDVPNELLITGFDNTADQPPIRRGYFSTAPDFVAAGEKAVELAMQHLRGELEAPVAYMLPVPVVQRTARRTEVVHVPASPGDAMSASGA